MKSRTPNRLYRGTPRGRRFVLPLLWLGWATGTVVIAASSSGAYVLQTHVAPQTVFHGTLSPIEGSFQIELPAGAVLHTVEAKPGERVLAGRTVMSLDRAAMKSELEVKLSELRVTQFTLDCLLGYHQPSLDPANDAEQVRFQVAAELCAHASHDYAAELAALRGRFALFLEERRIIDLYLSLLLARTESWSDSDVKRALGLRLARNSVDRDMLRVEDELHALQSRKKMERRSELRLYFNRITLLAEQAARLEQLIAAPRVVMPQDGVILRVRNLESDTARLKSLPLIEAKPMGQSSYGVQFAAPLEIAGALQASPDVIVRVMGLKPNLPALEGKVLALSRVEKDEILVDVSLASSAVEILNDPRHGVALQGQSTASSIEVLQQPMPLRQRLSVVLLKLADLGGRDTAEVPLKEPLLKAHDESAEQY